MENEKENKLFIKACTYESKHGSVASLEACVSALNYILVKKGLVTTADLDEVRINMLEPNSEIAEEPVGKLATEAEKLDAAKIKTLKTALSRYEKILRNSNSCSSLRCTMLEESARVAEEFQFKPISPEREISQNIWRVVQTFWNDTHQKGQNFSLLVEASSAAAAAILAGEDEDHETASIENLGPVVVKR